MKVRNPLTYIFLLIAFFMVLFLMDSVFGLNYKPLEHEELEEIIGDHAEAEKPVEVRESLTLEQDTPQNSEKPVINNEEIQPAPEEKIISNSEVALADDAFFKTLLKNYEQNVLKNLPPNKPRTDIIIRYYQHAPDGKSAYALQKLRFYIHEREVAPEYVGFQSNAIFYGDSVSVEDIQLVTYTLIKEGLPIKIIRPSKFAGSWKAKSIEIGTDTTALDRPDLSLDELKRLAI